MSREPPARRGRPGDPDHDALERGHVFVTPEGAFAEAAAVWLARLLLDLCGQTERRISVALAGGSTPRGVYEALASLRDVHWDRVEIFFGDERAVPAEHVDSNYRMARESLLDRVPILSDQVHAMNGTATSLARAAQDYAALLPRSLDLLLLGIGADGHTASLFPGAETLREQQLRVVPATAPDPPRNRLTVTPAVVRHARRIVVMASGRAKASSVARALAGRWDPAGCPAQLARRGSWILDPAAASELDPALTSRLSPTQDGAA